MDFIIPAILLKPNKWNYIQIEWNSYSPERFGLKVNKPFDAEPTIFPVVDSEERKKFKIKLDTREVVST